MPEKFKGHKQRQPIPHPEFLAYAKHMERIKKLIMKVHKAPVPHDPDDIAPQAIEIRRILEAIVNACLVVQMAFDDSGHLLRFAKMTRAQVLKDRVDGDHYPSPPNIPIGPTALIVAPGVARNEYLTRDRWFTVWDACNALVHEERPGSSKPKPRQDTYGTDSRTWLQWIVNLLTIHTIPSKDSEYTAEVVLHDHQTKSALLKVHKRTTQWLPAHLPGQPGGDHSIELGILQEKIDGEWQDLKPTKINLAILPLLGYYTSTTYHPTQPIAPRFPGKTLRSAHGGQTVKDT